MVINKRVQKEDVVKAALEILKTDSLEELTARRLAEVLHCSVQPIFYNFKSMDELKQIAIETMYHIYHIYMTDAMQQKQPYKATGLAYIRFARDYPNYFRILFMMKTDLTANAFLLNTIEGKEVIEYGMRMTGFDREKQETFHLKVWIFTHGLATLVSTQTVQLNDEEIEKLLTSAVQEMLAGAQKGEK